MMDLIKVTLQLLGKIKQLIFIKYLSGFLLSGILGIYIYSKIYNGLDNSMEMQKLINGFDRTVMDDLLTGDPTILNGLLPIVGIILALYFIVSNFISAGIYSAIHSSHSEIKQFAKNGLKRFFPFLGISLIFFLIWIIIGFLLFFTYIKILGNPFNDYTTETPFFYSLLTVIGIFLIFSSYLWMWSIATKFEYLSGGNIVNSIKNGFRNGLTNFKNNTLLLLIFWVVFILLMIIMNYLQGWNSSQSWLTLLLLFFGMQGTVLMRTYLQFFVVGGVYGEMENRIISTS